ncbi:MAG TPA: CIA30 family protein [Kiritimatiellia bacterium]|nr:CIA30 family protein [Kiritimatiellia bacterium]
MRTTILAGLLGFSSIGCSAPQAGITAADKPKLILYDFTQNREARDWRVEDDRVMGGVSSGSFRVNESGNGVFSGTVSLDNNGGFSSVQYFFDPIDIRGSSTAVIRLKGDGKTYRFLVQSQRRARHYYTYEFGTDGTWQTIRVPLSEMAPERRGDRLDLPNYPAETLAQLHFMIANKRAESFRLEVGKIWLE